MRHSDSPVVGARNLPFSAWHGQRMFVVCDGREWRVFLVVLLRARYGFAGGQCGRLKFGRKAVHMCNGAVSNKDVEDVHLYDVIRL